jgi:hypothetical protein
MATLSGNLYGTEFNNTYVAEPEVKNDVTLQHGRLRYLSGTYTIPSGDVIGTSAIIKLFKLPKGARVIECLATSDDLGTTGDLNIGWAASEETDENDVVLEAADEDGFFVALDVNAGAVSRTAMASTVAGYRKKFDAAVDVQVQPSEITTGAGDILLEMYYVLD